MGAVIPFRLARRGPGSDPPSAVGAATPGPPPGESPRGRRILALHLPRFAVERRLARRAREGLAVPPDVPFALLADGAHGPVVHDANPAARAAGAHPGARAVDARAVCPALVVEPADPRDDEAALLALALWCRRWCPWTAPDGADGIVLDVTGAAHLAGGEAALLGEVAARLGALGLTVRLGLGPTRGAAWALARFGEGREAVDEAGLAARVAPLPVRALRLGPDAVRLLRRLGLGTVGDLAAVPRLPLARRFARSADDPLGRLDQMLGRRPEPVDAPDEPPRFLARAVLSEPVLDPLPLLPALARDLCAMLAAEGMGARRVALHLFRTDGLVPGAEAATARATRDPAHLARLFDGRLENLDPGFGFDLVTLGAPVAEPLGARQPSLDGRRDAGDDLARLVDRLAARLGPRALRRPHARESHVPERSEGWASALGPSPGPVGPPARPRPLRLLDPPEEVSVLYALPEGPPAQFVWRRVTHRVARVAGPERIGPEWWRDRPGTRLRDYFRVEDQEGRRVWLYREGLPDDGRGGTPRWFVQGIFG